jgi:hypothetical protein
MNELKDMGNCPEEKSGEANVTTSTSEKNLAGMADPSPIFRFLLRVVQIFNSFVIPGLAICSGLALLVGEGLAGFILAMLAVCVWGWRMRPKPNPYDDTSPSDAEDGFD